MGDGGGAGMGDGQSKLGQMLRESAAEAMARDKAAFELKRTFAEEIKAVARLLDSTTDDISSAQAASTGSDHDDAPAALITGSDSEGPNSCSVRVAVIKRAQRLVARDQVRLVARGHAPEKVLARWYRPVDQYMGQNII